MEAREWIERFAGSLGTEPPSGEEVEQLLAMAGIAAHASERIAAPVSCWIAACAGVSLEDALAAAKQLAAANLEETDA